MKNNMGISRPATGLLSALFLLWLMPGVSQGADVWQETLDQHFDIAETFNDLQDWYGTTHSSGVGDTHADDHPDRFPKKTDGTPSMWCYYSKWTEPSASDQNWIGNFGPGTYWGTGGKSAIIDLSSTRGPSRLGTYFGNGDTNSGYKELYVFYMVKISRKQWPTSCGCSVANCNCGNTGTYSEGQNYSYWGSWKFNTIGTGWNTCKEWNGSSPPDFADRYGDSNLISSIKVNNYGPIPKLDGRPEQKQNLVLEMAIHRAPQDKTKAAPDENTQITSLSGTAVDMTGKGGAVITDEWMGVEFHYKLETQAGSSYNGKFEAWIYNKDGEALRAFYIEGVNFLPSSGSGHRFNRFFLGGNNSKAYKWGPTMEAPYSVDDFIVDDSRIGPTYFSLQGETPPSTGKPKAPANLKIISVE